MNSSHVFSTQLKHQGSQLSLRLGTPSLSPFSLPLPLPRSLPLHIHLPLSLSLYLKHKVPHRLGYEECVGMNE